MADIRNINFGGTVPDKRMAFYNGQPVEIKRTYRIVKGVPEIIWDVGDIPPVPAVNEFILTYKTTAYSGQYYIGIPILEADSDVHRGAIDWGDTQSGGYASNMRYTHYYDSAGIYTVTINAPIEYIRNGSNNLPIFPAQVISSVKFPESMKTIGDYAFQNHSLGNIDFANVERIGMYAFAGDTILYNDDLKYLYAKEVISIDVEAFSRKRKLVSIDFPKIETIGNSCFYYCTSLENVTIPAVKYINSYAFRNCTSLKSIEIPDTIEFISYNSGLNTNAFDGCTNLRNIVINKPYNSIPGAPWGAVNAQILWRG